MACEAAPDLDEEDRLKCLARFGSDSNTEIAYLVNQTFANAGIVACGTDNFAKAIQYLDQAVHRLKSASQIEDRRVLSSALVNRAATLLKSGAVEEAR
jgi:tetratricopeptide (TPR) repeat protein